MSYSEVFLLHLNNKTIQYEEIIFNFVWNPDRISIV